MPDDESVDQSNPSSHDASDDPDVAESQASTDDLAKDPDQAKSVSILRFFGFGLCMGTADAVPGVSGGTIALILGYYDQFIDALAQVIGILTSPFKAQSWVAAIPSFKLLFPLVFGAICALFIATKLLVGKSLKIGDLNLEPGQTVAAYIQAHPPQGLLLNPDTAPLIFAVFFGLVLFSIPQPWQCIRARKSIDWLNLLIGAGIVAAISLLNPTSIGINPFLIIISGMLAISVMLLPGISGSLVLLIIGMYQPVSQAIHNREFDIIAYFGLGIVLGVASFVPLLRYILHKHHDRTMSALTGLMLGSLVALWPWKTHYLPKFINELGPMLPILPSDLLQILSVIGCCVGGIVLIYTLQKIASE